MGHSTTSALALATLLAGGFAEPRSALTTTTPLLEQLSPSVVGHLNALADELAEAREGPGGELNRAQRMQIREAERAGRKGVMMKMKEGREVWVAVAGEEAMLSLSELSQAPAPGDRRTSTPGPVGGTLDRDSPSTPAQALGAAKERP